MLQSIGQIKLGNSWAFTPVIAGEWLRFKHTNAPFSPIGWMAQAELVPGSNLHNFYGITRLNGLVPYETINCLTPLVFVNRKLAFRQEIQESNNWTVEIEVYTMPLNNPTVAYNHTSTAINSDVIPVPQNVNNAVVLAQANSSRKGISLWNNSTGNIYVNLDDVPTLTDFTVKLVPGGYYEIPFGYTGQVQGLWDAAGGNGVLVKEFI